MTLGVIEVGDVKIWFTNPPVEVKVQVTYWRGDSGAYTIATLTPYEAVSLVSGLKDALDLLCGIIVT